MKNPCRCDADGALNALKRPLGSLLREGAEYPQSLLCLPADPTDDSREFDAVGLRVDMGPPTRTDALDPSHRAFRRRRPAAPAQVGLVATLTHKAWPGGRKQVHFRASGPSGDAFLVVAHECAALEHGDAVVDAETVVNLGPSSYRTRAGQG